MKHVRPYHFVFSLHSLWRSITWLVLCSILIGWGLKYLIDDFRGRAIAALEKNTVALQQAVRILPNEPSIHRELGLIYLLDPLQHDIDAAAWHLHRAVELSPFDYNLQLDWGRALEQQNKLQVAEQAYQKAIALAPNYFRPQWRYANFLLRQDRTDEGVAQLIRLIETDPDLAMHTLDVIWQATNGSSQALIRLGEQLRSDQIRADVVMFLSRHNYVNESIRLWQQLTDSRLRVNSGLQLVSHLWQQRRWDDSQQLWHEIVQTRFGSVPAQDRILWNGGFEHDPLDAPLDWRLENSAAISTSLDSTIRRSGARALRIEFKQTDGVRLSNLYHDVVVNASTAYQLEFFYQTQGLLPRNGLMVEVVDPDDAGRVRASAPLSNPDQWTMESIAFSTSAQTRVVRIRIVRSPINPLHDYIAGRVWFDDFRLIAR